MPALILALLSLFLAASNVQSGPVELTSVDGRTLRPFGPGGVRALVFLASDCPISNGYAPEIRRICGEFASKGVQCQLFYEDLRLAAADARHHMNTYGYRGFAAAVDGRRNAAERAGATVTPEAVVVDARGSVRYRGRIDNRYQSLGTQRRVMTEFDLRDALDAVVAGRAVRRPVTQAVGCYIVPANVLENRP
jgi:hypothetical protein